MPDKPVDVSVALTTDATTTSDPGVDAALRALEDLTMRRAAERTTEAAGETIEVDLAHDVALVTEVHRQLQQRLSDLST